MRISLSRHADLWAFFVSSSTGGGSGGPAAPGRNVAGPALQRSRLHCTVSCAAKPASECQWAVWGGAYFCISVTA